MQQLVDKQLFEEAAVVRDEIKALQEESEDSIMNEHSMYMSEWMEHGEETPVVMSSRIRLARNLDNHVHPLMFTSDIEGQKSLMKYKMHYQICRLYN